MATSIWHAYRKLHKNSILLFVQKKKKPNHHFILNFLHKQCGQAENYAFDCRRELEKWQKFIIRCCLQIDFPLLNGCVCVLVFFFSGPSKSQSLYVGCASNVYGKQECSLLCQLLSKNYVCVFFSVSIRFFFGFSSTLVECNGKRMHLQANDLSNKMTRTQTKKRGRKKNDTNALRSTDRFVIRF